MFKIETNRLVIEEINLDDAQFIYDLMNTKGWLRFIGNRNINSITEAQNYISNKFIWAYNNWGYGPYKVSLKNQKISIGICTLVKRNYLENLDIGFAVLPEFEGKGYMYESTKAMLDYALKELKQEKVFAFTEIDNKRSISLLKKLGLKDNGFIVPEGEEEELSLFCT
jgi:RimJ/RimL family protein N-acetyltransferase